VKLLTGKRPRGFLFGGAIMNSILQPFGRFVAIAAAMLIAGCADIPKSEKLSGGVDNDPFALNGLIDNAVPDSVPPKAQKYLAKIPEGATVPPDAKAAPTKVRIALQEMRAQSIVYCLADKDEQNRQSTLFSTTFNFADVAVATAAPIAAFAAGANASITGLVGGLAGIFSSQLKTAIGGGATSATDFGQTLGMMNTVYDLFDTDLTNTSPTDAVHQRESLHLFKLAMERTCFSSLAFSGDNSSKPVKGDPSSGDNTQPPTNTGAGGQNAQSHTSGHH